MTSRRASTAPRRDGDPGPRRSRAATLVRAALVLASCCGLTRAQSPPRVLEDAPTRSITEFELIQSTKRVRDVRELGPGGVWSRAGIDQDGRAVDVERERQSELELAVAGGGKIHPTLAERLAALAAWQPIEIALWLREPDDGVDLGRFVHDQISGLPEELLPVALDEARRAALALNEARLAARVQAVSDAVRQARGEVLVAGLGWPLVIARVQAGDVRQLAGLAEVGLAYVSQPHWLAENDFAAGTMRVWNVHDQGNFADGDVQVMVNDVGGVQTVNPWLPPIVELVPGGPETHATSVAGNIANQHWTKYAAAYSLPVLYSGAGDGDAAAPSVWSAAIAAGVDLGNCSWWNQLEGNIEFLDRYFDYTIRNFAVLMFKSNGNLGNTAAPYATTPGNGYNMLCSGAYTDGNDWDWSNDSMASYSSWLDPIEGHEKPEVASPGDCVDTTAISPDGTTLCFGGTSSASPLTCGIGALVSDGVVQLAALPGTLKALLMVSAWQNVEGAALRSEKDGAGGVDALAAWAVARDGQWWNAQVSPGENQVGSVIDVPMTLLAGDETRAIALWLSASDPTYATDVLQFDADLAILDPQGSVVASSASAVEPFELASFVPASSGVYTARLTIQGFTSQSESLSVAWSTRADTQTGQVVLSALGGPFQVGQTPKLSFRDRYAPVGSPYVVWAALSGPPGVALPGGLTQPICWDGVSEVVLGLPGFTGVLGPLGDGEADLPLPDEPGLAGLGLWFDLAVLDGGVPGAIVNLSDPLQLVIQP